MIRRKRIAILFLVVLTLCMPIFAYFHIMLPSREIVVSSPEARAYQIDEEYVLLVWGKRLFMIYPEGNWVGRPSDYRNRLLGNRFWPADSALVFWPRGAYESVPVGDAVKGDPREKYAFSDNKLRIIAFFSPQDEQGSALIVKLPDAN